MDIQVGYYPQVFLLVLARTGAIVGGAAVLGGRGMPVRIRAALALILALLFTPLLSSGSAFALANLANVFDLVMVLLNEVLLGFVIAFVSNIVFMVCSLAGFVIGFGSSLSMAQAIDPASGISGAIFGSMLQLVCTVIFVINDVHLVLIRLLYQSFDVLPLNPAAWLTSALLSDIVLLFQQACIWAVKLAAPMLAVDFVLCLALGLIARMAPDFNILFLSLPIRLSVGFMTFGFILVHGGSLLSRLGEILLRFSARVLVGG